MVRTVAVASQCAGSSVQVAAADSIAVYPIVAADSVVEGLAVVEPQWAVEAVEAVAVPWAAAAARAAAGCAPEFYPGRNRTKKELLDTAEGSSPERECLAH